MRSTSSTSAAAALALISAAAAASSSSSSHGSNLVSAFVPTRSTTQNSGSFSRPTASSSASVNAKSTKLSFGMNDDPSSLSSSASKKKADINPEKLQAYITEPPQSRTRTSELGRTVLVSGFVDGSSPTLGKDSDQAIFDLLNDPHYESGLDFTNIVAFVPDASFAKKRLVSRSARYSGLLNKLSFAEAAAGVADPLPSPEQLNGVTTWVARIESTDPAHNLDTVQEIVYRTRSSSTVQNVALLLCDASALDMEAALDVIKTLEEDGKKFTVVAVGKTDGDVPEATLPYAVSDLFAPRAATTTATTAGPVPGDTAPHYATTIPSSPAAATTTTATVPSIPSDATYSREESFRLLTTCLGLECGRNQALYFVQVDNVNATSYKLVKGLREAGYTWSQELEHMVEGGVENYDKAVEEYKAAHPEDPRLLMSADEKLQEAIAEAMARQDTENEEALHRMEAKTALSSEFILEMSEDSIAAPDWA